jgi:hypothetical protein
MEQLPLAMSVRKGFELSTFLPSVETCVLEGRADGAGRGSYQVFSGNELRLQTRGRINHGFQSPFPCRVKLDAGNGRQNIEAFRVAAKPEKAVGVGEVFRADALERCAKLGKCGISRLRVVGLRFDEQIHVPRKARL